MKLYKMPPSIFNQLLVWLILSVSIEFVFSAQISHLYSKKCDYLQITETQHFNSYTVSGKLCCLCPAGKKFVGDCNMTHPNTTYCEECEENKYISYSGHKNTKCEVDRGAVCLPPFVVIPGTSTKEMTCGCPSGYVPKGRSCSKLVNATTTTPTKGTTTTSSSTTTTKSTATPKTTATTVGSTSIPRIPSTTSREVRRRTNKPRSREETNTHRPADLEGETDDTREKSEVRRRTNKPRSREETNTHRPADLEGETDDTREKKPSEVNAWVVLLIIIVLILILAGVLVASYFVYKRCYRKIPLPNNQSVNSSPDSSNTSLLYNSKNDSVGFVEELSTPMNAAEPIRHRENPVQACPPMPQSERHNNAPVQGQTVAEVVRNPRNVRDAFDLHEKYAGNLGTALGDKFAPNEIRPFFRHLGVSGTDIDDLTREYKSDTKELVYQLTMGVYRQMGSGFHRDFLVGKVETMPIPQRNLLPPIINEWDKLIGNTHNPPEPH